MTTHQKIERLENHYGFECEGGPLRNCVEWQELKVDIVELRDALNGLLGFEDVLHACDRGPMSAGWQSVELQLAISRAEVAVERTKAVR